MNTEINKIEYEGVSVWFRSLTRVNCNRDTFCGISNKEIKIGDVMWLVLCNSKLFDNEFILDEHLQLHGQEGVCKILKERADKIKEMDKFLKSWRLTVAPLDWHKNY